MRDRKKVTVSMPKDLLDQARRMPAEKGMSVSAMLADYLKTMVRDDHEYRRAAARIRKRLERGFDLGTGDRVTWTRDELHRR
ncbi:type II toxin-antitoxin system CcdA family antitoxin [bacterium]|nr:type II toxin-antitoxin system CcdA family antitoxin [bacterium]